jgi:hypothetical protein
MKVHGGRVSGFGATNWLRVNLKIRFTPGCNGSEREKPKAKNTQMQNRMQLLKTGLLIKDVIADIVFQQTITRAARIRYPGYDELERGLLYPMPWRHRLAVSE